MIRVQSLEGKRIGYTVRQSKGSQVGNSSTDALDKGMREHLEREGAEAVAFNENEAAGGRGVSGRDAAKRDEFLRMLEFVKRKPGDPERLDGVGGWDIKRLTRDESGKDAGMIYRVLVKHRALLVTVERVYRLWLESDHDAYRLECLKAGWDIRSINTTFWRGIFEDAEVAPFFRGIPPVGYGNRETVVPDPKRTEGSRIERTPQKHPGHAALMADLIRLLDTAPSQGDVAARLWERWGPDLDKHDRQRHPEMRGGGWHAGRVRAILENPLYWGEWALGGQCDRLNPLWDIDHRREKFEEEGRYQHVLDGLRPCPCGRTHEDIGVLAYWTKTQARAWRARLGDLRPQRRRSKRAHPLRGVLACAACGAPMIGAGRHGYVCAGRNTRTCDDPQQLAEGAARRELRKLLPEALERGKAAIQRAALFEETTRTPRAQALVKRRRELDAVQEQLAGMLRLVGAKTSPTVTAEVQRLMGEEAALLAGVDRLERGARTAAEALAQLRDTVGDVADPAAWFDDDLDEEEQGEVYGLLLADVRFKGAGRGAGRTYTLVGEPRHKLEEQAAVAMGEPLGDTHTSAPSPRSTPAYVSIPPQALPETLTHLTALLRRRTA